MTSMIVESLIEFGGPTKNDIAKKLVCFKVDGVIIF